MEMKLSKAGSEFIRKHEGCRLTAYKVKGANEKYWTIGYGHYGADVKEGMTITQAEADKMFEKDVQRFVDHVNALVTVDVNQNQFDALVSFCYNVGPNNLKKSTLLKLVNEKKFDQADDEFDKWNKAGGKVMAGLVRRRDDEEALFEKPVPNPVEKPKPKPTPAKAIVPYPGKLITKGSKDVANIKRIQNALGIQPHGSFDNGTYYAVRNYQARHGLVVDGKVGLNTWNTLF